MFNNNINPFGFLGRVGPMFTFCPSSSDSDSDSDSDDVKQQYLKGEWPTYTAEELFRTMKEMNNKIKQNRQQQGISPCSKVKEDFQKMYKIVSEQVWTFGSVDDEDFKIEPNDNEVIVNYKICMMAAEVLPNLFDCRDPNGTAIRGFLKYIYCLDPNLGTSLLCSIERGSIGYLSQSDIDFDIKQSMKIPDWKISLFLSCIKIVEGCESEEILDYFYFEHFQYVLTAYYDTTKWEGLYIDMSEIDYMLLNELLEIDHNFERLTFMTLISKVAYQHYEYGNPKLPSIPMIFQKFCTHISYLNSTFPFITHDIQVIEKESYKIIPKDERLKRIRKLIAVFEHLDKRSDNNGITDIIATMLVSLLKLSDDDIKLECLKALTLSNQCRTFHRCKKVIKAIMPILDGDNILLREEAYKCGAVHLTVDYNWEPEMMQRIISSFSENSKPQANYLKIFTAAFKYFSTQSTFTEKALQIIQRVAEFIKDEEYFLEVAEILNTFLSIPNLPVAFVKLFINPLDDLLLYGVNMNKVDIVVNVQNLVGTMIGTIIISILQLKLDREKEKEEYGKEIDNFFSKFHVPEMLIFLVDNKKDLSSCLVSVILDSPYCDRKIKIHPELSNEELFAKSLAQSEDPNSHNTLGRILNKFFIENGRVLVSQSEIDRLVYEKIRCPNIYCSENQKFIYSVAHFGSNFEKIADDLGNFGCINTFMYDIGVNDVMLTNYLKVLEYNISVRPKQLDFDEIYDILVDSASDERTNLFLNSQVQRVKYLLEIYVSENQSDDDTDSDDEMLDVYHYDRYFTDSDETYNSDESDFTDSD